MAKSRNTNPTEEAKKAAELVAKEKEELLKAEELAAKEKEELLVAEEKLEDALTKVEESKEEVVVINPNLSSFRKKRLRMKYDAEGIKYIG